LGTIGFHALMNTPNSNERQWNERSNAGENPLAETDSMFRMLFERSADAMSLFDPETMSFVESNDAVARQVGVPNKEALGKASPMEISPERQPDGRLSSEKATEMVKLAVTNGSHRFEWLSRRHDGTDLPLDVVMTAVPSNGRTMLFVVSRDISAQKKAEEEILRLNALLEQRVAQRTVELVRANDQLKDEIAERRRQEKIQRKRSDQMQRHREVLLELTQVGKIELNEALKSICARAATTLGVARVSYWSLVENGLAVVCSQGHLADLPQSHEGIQGARLSAAQCPTYFQALADRRPIVAHDVFTHSATKAISEKYFKVLGITSLLDVPVWVRGEVVGVLSHEHTGPRREWSAEEVDFASALAAVVSLALEESYRMSSERLLRESEEKFRALFEASSQGVILHDEEKMIEVNPACVRILGFSSPDEIVGRHPAQTSAPIQPNGETAEVLARKHIQECMTRGSTRFDWLARNPRGEDIPIEVILTRIQWSGRQLIQAVFNDISERKKAETELRRSEARLRESEARFSAAFRASPVSITISRYDHGKFILANEAFLRWTGYHINEVLGRDSLELGLWIEPADRVQIWEA
jgi:PAS domain S-box-containing protein